MMVVAECKTNTVSLIACLLVAVHLDSTNLTFHLQLVDGLHNASLLKPIPFQEGILTS
jgi:hypothetical protein